MADTEIDWTDKVWNVVRGCSRVSPGCDHCYAMGQAHRFSGPGGPYEGLTTIRRGKVDWSGYARFVPEKLSDPFRWRKTQRVFVNSMSDLFHESLSFDDIAAVFGVMAACPQHTFQVLTKRPQRALEFFSWVEDSARADDGDICRRFVLSHAYRDAVSDGSVEDSTRQWDFIEDRLQWVAYDAGRNDEIPWPLPNVHLGVSVENQKTADERIPLLLQCPAAVRWVSAEPLLGTVDLSHWLNLPEPELAAVDPLAACLLSEAFEEGRASGPRSLDWVVVGGESGNSARPCNVEWIRSIVSQCKDAGVPVFVKQLGAVNRRNMPLGLTNPLYLFDKKGSDPSEWPVDLRVREFPELRGEL